MGGGRREGGSLVFVVEGEMGRERRSEVGFCLCVHVFIFKKWKRRG